MTGSRVLMFTLVTLIRKSSQHEMIKQTILCCSRFSGRRWRGSSVDINVDIVYK